MIKVKTCTNQRINATSLSLLSTLYSVHICKITSSFFSPFTHFSHILCQSELDVLFDFQQVVLFFLFFFINGNYPCSCLLLQMKYRMYHNQRNVPDTFVRNSKLSSTWCTGKSLFVFKKKKNSLHENVTNCILILHLLLIPLLILQTQELYQTVPQKCVWIHSKGQSKHEDQSLFLTLSSSPSFPRPASSRPIVIHQAEVSWGNV